MATASHLRAAAELRADSNRKRAAEMVNVFCPRIDEDARNAARPQPRDQRVRNRGLADSLRSLRARS
jgi:hypothetical protein